MYTVERIPLVLLGFIFVLYVVIHFIILRAKVQFEEKVKEKPGNIQNEQNLKYLTILGNWFPAAAVVIIIILLYLM